MPIFQFYLFYLSRSNPSHHKSFNICLLIRTIKAMFIFICFREPTPAENFKNMDAELVEKNERDGYIFTMLDKSFV